MPAETAHRVIAADLGAAFGAGWRQRLVAFGDTPLAAASIGQVHRGRWRDDRGRIVEVAVKVQYPGVGQALRSDLRQARLLARVMPFGQLAAAVLAGDGPMAVRLARRVGALAPGPELDERLVVEMLHPMVATAAADSFSYSRPWLRGLTAHFTEPGFARALRNLTPPREYALVWRATLSAAGLFAQLGATVPTRGFHLAYSPGFRDGTLGAQRLFPRSGQAGRWAGTGV